MKCLYTVYNYSKELALFCFSISPSRELEGSSAVLLSALMSCEPCDI